MSTNKKAWTILLAVVLLVKLFSLFPDAVEMYYSTGIYPKVAAVQRILFGWLPFSIGDLFYLAIGIYLLLIVYGVIRSMAKKQAGRAFWLMVLRKIFFYGLLVYAVFNLLWGLNYNRRGIVRQLGLENEKISKDDLAGLMQEIVFRLNNLDSAARQDRNKLARKKILFLGAESAYDSLASRNPIFNYRHPSVKPSLFSYLGNYLGYTGYYNPFSGEAQVNTTVPLFIQPFTTCHEIGHQLGYARENEANFAGYLAAKSSADPAFRYSVYFDMYSYGRFYLYWQDSMLVKKLDTQLHATIKQDFRDLKKFLLRHENPAEEIIDRLYAQYLKANEQPAGRITYNQVVLWLIAYYKKYGKDAL